MLGSHVASSGPAAAHLGRAIRRWRKRRRLSQDELAARVGLQRGDLTRIEKGECRIGLETIFRLLEELEVGMEELLREVPDSQAC